jgi:hypothetical protein
MGDKEKSIIGTNSWIGAFEVNLCMQHFADVIAHSIIILNYRLNAR